MRYACPPAAPPHVIGCFSPTVRKTSKTQLTVTSHPLTSLSVAQMAELVDAQVSGTCAARRGGSSPLLGTIRFCPP